MHHGNETTAPLVQEIGIPCLGLGTWKIPESLAPDLIREAVRVGWRHFDCACDYGNESAVGAGLAMALADGRCRREELWITSKLWNTYHEPQHVRPACERSLADLRLDWLDLYLLHFPISLAFVPFEVRYPPGWLWDPRSPHLGMRPIRVPLAETWGAMEELVRAGLVRRIGVCNMGTAMLRDLLSYAAIRPAVLQVEMHPYLPQERLLRFCREEGIAVTAFSPFGADSYVPLGMAAREESPLGDPAVAAVAERLRRTPAQILLRWAVQRGTIAIPKTQQSARLKENLAIFDFSLGDEDMQRLASLNRNRRFNDPGEFCEKAFHTFFPIFD